MQQIIPADILGAAHSILFIFDLSLRDLLSVQAYIAQVSRAYPEIKIDLWLNPVCRCVFGHRQSFEEKLFVEFLRECKFLNLAYVNTCSSKLLKNNLAAANQCGYSVEILLSKKNICRDTRLARRISGNAFLVGLKPKIRWHNFITRRACKRLDQGLDLDSSNPGEIFGNLFGEQYMLGYRPAMSIPRKWIIYAKLRFMKWGIDKKGQRFGKVFFINAFNDDGSCGCAFKRVLKVITDLKRNDEWGDINFVLHVPPSQLRQVRMFFAKYSINNLFLFSADSNFYQIPSILSLCDGAFSTDGICSELSALLGVNNLDCAD